MKVQSLGHVVLRVSNLERAEAFYSGILGLPVCARYPERQMVFFSLGDHHDFAIASVGEDAPPAAGNTAGLAHVAFRLGDDLEILRKAKADLEAAGVTVQRIVDHEVSKSIYVNDPDGNGIEVYVDGSDIWKTEPQRVAQAQPLAL
ncbi:MAG: VOC family protein [Alphaproteobacteria bacterium]